MDVLDGGGLPGWLLPVLGGALVVVYLFIYVMRKWESAELTGKHRTIAGKLVGVAGLMGAGKTSFMVHQFVVPRLIRGQRVVSTFAIDDSRFPGTAIKLGADNFAGDLLGIGSSLNLEEDGSPGSGWFLDTACTCGKVGVEQRQCGCNGATVIIDECHAFVPQIGTTQLPSAAHIWFTMARKNHVEIVWATQHYGWVHSTLRRLTSYVYTLEPALFGATHIAEMHVLDGRGQLGEVQTTVKFSGRKVWGIYDSWEVTVPGANVWESADDVARQRRARKLEADAA